MVSKFLIGYSITWIIFVSVLSIVCLLNYMELKNVKQEDDFEINQFRKFKNFICSNDRTPLSAHYTTDCFKKCTETNGCVGFINSDFATNLCFLYSACSLDYNSNLTNFNFNVNIKAIESSETKRVFSYKKPDGTNEGYVCRTGVDSGYSKLIEYNSINSQIVDFHTNDNGRISCLDRCMSLTVSGTLCRHVIHDAENSACSLWESCDEDIKSLLYCIPGECGSSHILPKACEYIATNCTSNGPQCYLDNTTCVECNFQPDKLENGNNGCVLD